MRGVSCVGKGALNGAVIACCIICMGLVTSSFARAENVLSLGGISVGDERKDVMSALGRPRRSETQDGFVRTEFGYDHLRVGFDESGLVVEVVSRNPKFCFEDWLCPGMKASIAKGEAVSRGADVSAREITVLGDSCWIVGRLDGRLVSAVELKCQP